MAVITAPILQTLRTKVDAAFQQGLLQAEPLYMKVATVVTSDSRFNTYGWLGAMPTMREWIGARVIHSIKEHGYIITNRTFENTVGISREDVEDDTIGTFLPMVEMFAQNAREFPDELVFQLFTSGFNSACYDGQNFFDLAHPVNEKHDGTGAVTSVANVATDANYFGGTWFLLDTTKPLKPMIYQERRALALNTLFNPTDPAAWTKNEYQFGADIRCEAGFGFWQLAFANQRELTYQTLWDSYQKMKAFKSDGGKKLKVNPNLLVIPSNLEQTALKLLERQFIDENGVTVENELKGKFELLIVPEL